MNQVVAEVGPYGINVLSGATLAAGGAMLAAGLYVVVAERREREAHYFYLVCLSAVLWLVPTALMYASPTRVGARTWAQASHVALPVIPAFVYHFTVELLGLEDSRRAGIQTVIWSCAGTFAVLFVTGFGVEEIRRYGWGWLPRYGLVGKMMVLYLVLAMGAAVAEFLRAWRRAPEGAERERTRWFLVAFAVVSGALLDLLPATGVPVPPLSPLFVLAFVALTGWTVLRYRLVDLTPAFAAGSILRTIGDPLLVCDAGGRIRLANPAVDEVLGHGSRELAGRHLQTLLPEDPERRSALEKMLRSETVRDREITFRAAGGKPVATSVSVSPLLAEGERVGSVVVARDIRDRKRAEEALRTSEEKFSKVFEVTPLAVSIATLEEGRFLEVNEGFEELHGWDREEAVGRTSGDLGLWADPADREAVVERLERHGTVRDFETRLRTRAGAELQVLFSGEKIQLQDQTCLVSAVHDITERKQFEAELRRQALYDGLTGLPNRHLFVDRVRQALARADREETAVGVLYLDLTDFRRVNDTLGYGEGDRVLEQIAARLEDRFRREDTVARVGGDEFAVLLQGMGEPAEAERGAGRVVEALSAPFEVEGVPVSLEPCVGIALSSEGDERPEDVLRSAHVAMRRAREEEVGWAVFDPDVDTSAMRRLHRENELRRALEEGQIFVVYQPILELTNGRVAGVEALARWRHPERGLVSPGQFVPLAEDAGLIGELGRQVLAEAARQVGAWRGADGLPAELRMSVNLSPREFRDPDLPDRVAATLEEHGIPPRHFLVEITESAIVQGRERVRELRERGVHVGVDDFGTGYSSLAYLETLDVDHLKVDRSFVLDLDRDPPDDALVRTILQLADALELRAIAEGIETELQLENLRRLGCPYGQGYLFTAPLEPEGMEAWLRERATGD